MKKYEKNSILMSRQEVRNVDSWAINQMGIPGVVLMENAGRSCAEFILQKLNEIEKPKVCIFCGTGNNGGDGFVIARHLINASVEVKVYICGDKNKIKGDAQINLNILEKMIGEVTTIDLQTIDSNNTGKLVENCHLIVDAIFGTGLVGNLKDEYVKLIELINAQKQLILAVDIPSGLDCDSGLPLGASITADFTVTFVAAKKGFLNSDSHKYTGEVYVASIGIEPKT